MVAMAYTRWRCKPIFNRPTTGATWWRGNFSLGLHVDIHQRWVNVILCLLVVEIGIGWSREARWEPVADTTPRHV